MTSGAGQVWMPATWLSLMLDAQLFGINAGGFHIYQPVAPRRRRHCSVSRVSANDRASFGPAHWSPCCSHIHPSRVEFGRLDHERKDVLSGLFFMLTLAAYVGYGASSVLDRALCGRAGRLRPRAGVEVDARDAALRAAAVGLLAAGTPCRPPHYAGGTPAPQPPRPRRRQTVVQKIALEFVGQPPSAVLDDSSQPRAAVPQVILGQPPNGKPAGRFALPARLILEKAPMFAMAAAVSVVICIVQGKSSASPYTFSWRIGNAMIAYVTYLEHFFYPVGLAILYPRCRPTCRSGGS